MTNSLASLCPGIVKQWDKKKTKLKPSEVTAEPEKLTPTGADAYGIRFRQPITIVGANGRVLENCKIHWLLNDETGCYEFKNLLLPKKPKGR